MVTLPSSEGWYKNLDAQKVGGMLITALLLSLGAPFWYNAVTGLTNIRGTVQQASGGGQKKASTTGQPAAAAPAAPAAPAVPATPAPTDPDRPQPDTPVGTFTIANAARP